MKQCLLLLIGISFSVILFSQTVVNMKMPSQSAEPLQVAALFDENIQPDYPVVLGIIGFEVAGGAEPFSYTWLKNDVAIGTGATVVVTPVAGSSYALRVTDKNNCVVLHSLNVAAIKKTVSINNRQFKVKIYPTKVYDQLNIDVSEFLPQNTMLKIYDSNGSIHFQQVLHSSTSISPMLSTGNYFVVIESSGKYFVEKIVVSKN